MALPAHTLAENTVLARLRACGAIELASVDSLNKAKDSIPTAQASGFAVKV